MHGKRGGPPGLTLLEVMLALALVALTILTMIGVFTGGLRLLSGSKEMAVATGLARDLMEQMTVVPYADIPEQTFDGAAGDPPAPGPFPPLPYPGFTVNGMDYTFKVTVASPRPNLKTVTTEVRWRDSSKKVVLQTYVANEG